MRFQWGGLTDNPDLLQAPPAGATRHRSSIDVIGYEKHDISSHDDGSVLVSTVLTERFSGAIEGIGVADHIRLLHPDGTGISTGIERIEGAVNGRTGSFILTAYGRNLSVTEVSGTWTVQAGSGTAELTGLRGSGSYTASADSTGRWHAEDEFVCWFEEPNAVQTTAGA
jgi:Protein of unknown function (DUF3224)